MNLKQEQQQKNKMMKRGLRLEKQEVATTSTLVSASRCSGGAAVVFVAALGCLVVASNALQPNRPHHEFAPVRPVSGTSNSGSVAATKAVAAHKFSATALFETASTASADPAAASFCDDGASSFIVQGILAASSLSESSSAASARNGENNNNNYDDKEQEEVAWELKVGKALDTLRSDYPYLLTEQPDFSIYQKDIEVVDPSGVTVHGLTTYKNSFRILHALVKCLYCTDQSSLTFRMCYDKARRNIRIHWNAHLTQRRGVSVIMSGGRSKDLYVDGISVYEMDPKSGLIVQHRMEQLLFNDIPIRPEQGVIAALVDHHTVSIPSFINTLEQQEQQATASVGGGMPNTVFEFQSSLFPQSNKIVLPGSSSPVSSLFAFEASKSGSASSSTSAKAVPPSSTSASASKSSSSAPASSAASDLASASTATAASTPASSSSAEQQQFVDSMDWEAFERKNFSRKKFGLKPLTPQEFVELEAEVQVLNQAMKEKQAANAAQAAQAAELKKKSAKGNLFDKLFGGISSPTCESNFDCERPEICCDFGFTKKCCASGTPVINGPRFNGKLVPALVPVPVETGLPPQGRTGPMNDPYNRRGNRY